MTNKIRDRYWRWLAYALWGSGLVVLGYFWLQGSAALFGVGLGASLLALGQLSGLLGMYSLLTQFVLISRAPWLERGFGFDWLTRIHHTNGLIAFTLISTHIPLVVLGNAFITQVTPLTQFVLLLDTYAYVLLAAIGYVLLLVLIGTSITIVKRRLRYEWWFGVHLLSFAILLLVFWHQVANGATILQYEVFRVFWYALFLGVLVHFVIFQIGVQLWLMVRHRPVVDRVEVAANDTVSIYIRGRGLEQLRYQGGQFIKWRFLAKGLWSEEHPFTVSAEPGSARLRLTVKAIGDYTARLQKVAPGTRVVISAPMGKFTLQRLSNTQKICFIAGGIGITPFRAMVGDEHAKEKDIVLLYSAKTKADIAFRDEFSRLTTQRALRIDYSLSGERVRGMGYGIINVARLKREVPDIAERHVFICGPPRMRNAMIRDLQELSVPPQHIYTERFSF